MFTADKERNPVGRPTKYKPEYCEMLIEHMSEGLSFESFAAVIDVSREVLWDWEKKHEKFLHAKKRAFDKCQLWWEKQARAGLWGSKETSFNTGVWVFNMKNRFKWTDRVQTEVSQLGTFTVNYSLDDADDDE